MTFVDGWLPIFLYSNFFQAHLGLAHHFRFQSFADGPNKSKQSAQGTCRALFDESGSKRVLGRKDWGKIHPAKRDSPQCSKKSRTGRDAP